MKKIVNGEYVEMTEEEYEEWKADIDAHPIPENDSPEEILNIILGGAE